MRFAGRRHPALPIDLDLLQEFAMTTVSEIMSTHVRVVQPQESLRSAAQLMQELDVGALPVSDGQHLLGMVTDRDIAVRGVAEGLKPEEACVSDIMTPEVQYCSQDEDTEQVMRQMGERQLRRLPVVDRNKKLVGIVSLADLAVRQNAHIDQTVREISEPSGQHS
jgi:CBS domain-containing protein